MQKGSNGENGHLIEILNQQEQEVLLNLTSTINPWEDEYYWIGLKYNGSSYVWISDVVENYIENITILTDTESYCVAVDREGNWLGLDCSDKYSYICQIPDVTIPTYITTNLTTSTPTNITTSETPGPEVKCSQNERNPTCMAIGNTRVDNRTDMTLNALQRNENVVLRILMEIRNLSFGERVTGFNGYINADIIVVLVNSKIYTNVTFENVTVEINADSFQEDPIIVSAVYQDIDSFPRSEDILSEVITIVSSEELTGNLGIIFSIMQQGKTTKFYCYSLSKNGTWSEEGITTTIINSRSVKCITTHLTTFALLSSTSICDVKVEDIHKAFLQTTSYTLLSVSLLFLLASIITFLISWKKIFHIDINVMNFNHSIALFLAIFVSIFGTELFSEHRVVCHGVAFLGHFFWTNVFLSSLSISILIFYSIWIVGIKHLARKLSPYLIPIAWSISIVWALIWLAYGIVNDSYINNNTDSSENFPNKPDCKQPCMLSTHSSLIYALIVPVISILTMNIFFLFLNLFRIRQAFKNKDRSEREVVRLRKVAFGGLLLVPSLGLPFLLSIPLSFSHLYTDHIALYLFFQWTNLITTATIGVLHFFLVTYQTPEVKLPGCIRSNKQLLTSDTSKPSTSSSQFSQQKHKYNVVRPIRNEPEVDEFDGSKDNTESQM